MRTESVIAVVCLLLASGCPADRLAQEDGGSEDATSDMTGDGDGDGDSETSGDGVCGDGIVEGDEECDDGNASDFDACTSGCSDFVVPTLQLSLSQVKQFDFSWEPVFGAEYYQLLESADMGAPYVQAGADVMGLASSLTVPLHFRLNASYKLRACKNGEGCTESGAVDVMGPLVEAIGYFKASNTGEGDFFGSSVALSGDGNTLAVGAPGEDSSAVGIGGDQADNSALEAGAVYVFELEGQGVWTQQAFVKASNTDAGDTFGHCVALSGDGSTLAVSAPYEASSAVGIGGDQADNSAVFSGAAYVFERDGQGAWTQQAYVKASNTEPIDYFGWSLALSGDGSTLAVSAIYEDSNAVGIGGDQADNSGYDSGAVYVFEVDGQGLWAQQAYVKASNTDIEDGFGVDLALSGDGNTLAVGASDEDSSAVGIGGNQGSNSADKAGAVYVFEADAQGLWTQQAYVKASNTDPVDLFGDDLALSSDGSTLAVGAGGEDSSAVGIGGDQADNSAENSGAVYVFEVDGQGAWTQQAYVKASNTDPGDSFGHYLALSGDGSTLAVTTFFEDSSSVGIGGNQAPSNWIDPGAAYVFAVDGQGVWTQEAYVKASNTGEGQHFGIGSAMSGDGNTLAFGAPGEESSSMGIGGNQADTSTIGAGAVYVY